MVNYACAFSQSEWGKYIESTMKGIKGTDLVHFVLNANITLPHSLKNKELYRSCIVPELSLSIIRNIVSKLDLFL